MASSPPLSLTTAALVAIAVLCSLIPSVAGVATYAPPEADPRAAREPYRLSTEPYNPAREVVTLTAADFETPDALDKYTLLLVLFHAPWSHSCQKIYPHFNDIARELAKSEPPIFVGEVDLTQHPDAGKRFTINGVPTMMVFRKGHLAKPSENQVPRDKEGILRHMRSLMHPPAEEVATAAEAKRFVDPKMLRPLKPHSLVVFGFLKGDLERDSFSDVAQTLQARFSFVYSTNPDVAKAYGEKIPSAVIYRGFDDGEPARFPTERLAINRQTLNEFVTNNSLPLVTDFTSDTRLIYAQRRQPMVILFSHEAAARNMHTPTLLAAARVWRNVSFTVANPWANEVMYEYLEVDGIRGRYGYALVELVGRKKYRLDGELTPTSLARFITGVESGAVPEFKKVEPLGHQPQLGEGRVFPLNFATLRDFLMHERRDVVVLFHNPRDYASSQLSETFTEIAARYTGFKQLVFGAFNGIANDQVDGFEVHAFPRIVMLRREHKSQPPLVYQGTRSVESIISWIETHATIVLDRETQESLREWEYS